MKKLNKKQSGQGMTEYILIVALIAVAVIGAVKFFSKSTDASFRSTAGTLTTQVGTSNTTGLAGQ